MLPVYPFSKTHEDPQNFKPSYRLVPLAPVTPPRGRAGANPSRHLSTPPLPFPSPPLSVQAARRCLCGARYTGWSPERGRRDPTIPDLGPLGPI
jgi:hypothetical protein